MFVPNLLLIVCLLLLLWAGLVLAKWALQQQTAQYWLLSELATLDARRKELQDCARALQKMDADSEILGVLFDAALSDITRIQQLDPARSDLDRYRKEADLINRQTAEANGGGSAAVATEAELVVAQRHIEHGLRIFTELYQSGRIGASQFESARSRLRTLGLRVAVNSSLLMAQRAVDQEDGIRAMACFRRAESLLGMRGLSTVERQEKQAYISAERERLFSSQNRGLLMLAVGQ
jgi:hypothetical protein